MAKIPAIILATNWSLVFPNRSLLQLGTKSNTVLSLICKRLYKSEYINKVILCTSDEKDDDSLSQLADQLNIDVIRGEKTDVLKRLLGAYKYLETDMSFVVRGDTPFVDSKFCDKLLESHLCLNAEYSYTEHIYGLPYGLGCEIINRSVLESMSELDLKGNYSQKVSLFIKLNENHFKTNKIFFETPAQDTRFVLENQKDYEFLNEVYSLAGKNTDVNELLNLLNKHPYLSKINKPDDVKEIGFDKLLLFPDKISSIKNNNLDITYPVSVELSLTNRCNLSCKWCSDLKLRKKRPESLDFNVYQRLISDLSLNGTKGLVIEGGGEPTIYPRFRDAVNCALNHDLAVGLITNGVKFDYEDIVPQMEWIRVSLDVDSRENFKKWKGHDYFYQVLSNLKKICKVKEKCVVGVGYVVTKFNVEHLEEITMLLADYGVDYLYLRPVIDNPEMRYNENLYYLKKYETDDFSVMIHAMEENTIIGNGGNSCVSHSLSSVISGDGAVFLCGRLNIHDSWQPIGNLNEESFSEIWRGRERERQSQMVNDSEFCLKWCPACRLTKYNIIFNNTSKIKTRNFI